MIFRGYFLGLPGVLDCKCNCFSFRIDFFIYLWVLPENKFNRKIDQEGSHGGSFLTFFYFFQKLNLISIIKTSEIIRRASLRTPLHHVFSEHTRIFSIFSYKSHKIHNKYFQALKTSWPPYSTPYGQFP